MSSAINPEVVTVTREVATSLEPWQQYEALHQTYKGEAFGLTQRKIADLATIAGMAERQEYAGVVRTRLLQEIEWEMTEERLGPIDEPSIEAISERAQAYLAESEAMYKENGSNPAIYQPTDKEQPLAGSPHVMEVSKANFSLDDEHINEVFRRVTQQLRKIGGKTIQLLTGPTMLRSGEVEIVKTRVLSQVSAE